MKGSDPFFGQPLRQPGWGPALLAAAVLAGSAAPATPAAEVRNSAREPARPTRPSGAASLPTIDPFPAGGRQRPVADPSKPSAEAVPGWERIQEAVSRHFEGLKDYQPGDLLARSDVEPLGTRLNDAGWQADDWKTIVADVLPDNDELVRALRTPRGRTFMRKIAALPGGYDRLEKLRALPNGSRQVRELIEAPGGERLIEYMTTTEGGKTLTRELEQKQSPRALKAAARRIYTEADLLKRLEAGFRQTAGAPAAEAEPPKRARPTT